MFPAQTEYNYQAFDLVFERKKIEFLNGSVKNGERQLIKR